MEILSKILEWLKLSPKQLFGMLIFCSVILFSPDSFLTTLGIKEFKEQFNFWIGVVFLLSFSILLSHFTIYLSEKIKRKLKKRFYFIMEGDGLKWKVKKYNGDVEFEPYCVKHGLELKEVGDGHFDPFKLYCVAGHSITKYSEYELRQIRDKVDRIANAKHGGHYKK